MSGLFESIASDENEQRKISRKALLLSETRIDKLLKPFLAAAKSSNEFDNRLSLVNDDFEGIVNVSCEEVGHNSPKNVYASLVAHYRPRDEEHVARTSSAHISGGRVKACPYHKEVMDISLASGDPASGFSAMAQHAWGPQHCQSEGYEGGNCNFKKEMVTQSYWDNKADKAKERKLEREQALEAPIDEFGTDVNEGPTEAVGDDLGAAEPVDEGFSDNVIDFPSESPTESQGAESIESEPMAVAASAHTAIRDGHFLAGVDPAAQEPVQVPATPHMNPQEIQQAMQVIEQAAMSNGGPQQAQRAQSLIGQLNGVLFGGVTSAAIPAPNVQKSYVPGLGMEPPAQAAPGITAQPQQQAMNPSQMQLQQAMLQQQQAQQAGQPGQPGSMQPTPVAPATAPMPGMPPNPVNPLLTASWTPILSKKVPCPSCGGDGKGAGGKTCSKCHGAGKVEDWGNSVLDELSSKKTAGEGNTGLGGPEPKIDKALWTPKNLPEPPVDDSKRNPTKRKDILEPMIYRNDAPLKEIGESNTKREELPTAKGMDDSGFKPGGPTKGDHTDTWHNNNGQTNPVTSSENPIRDIIENNFDGFVPSEVVQRTASRFNG